MYCSREEFDPRQEFDLPTCTAASQTPVVLHLDLLPLERIHWLQMMMILSELIHPEEYLVQEKAAHVASNCEWSCRCERDQYVL